MTAYDLLFSLRNDNLGLDCRKRDTLVRQDARSKLPSHRLGRVMDSNVSHFCVGIPHKRKILQYFSDLAVLGKVTKIGIFAYIFAVFFVALASSLFHQLGTEFPPSCGEQQQHNGLYVIYADQCSNLLGE